MSIANFLKLKEKLEIKAFAGPAGPDKKNHIPYSGSPRKHPYENSRVILIADPFSDVTFFYEFNIEDIVFVEELSSIATLTGESAPMVRVWVKKKSIALRCTPFVVDSLSHE